MSQVSASEQGAQPFGTGIVIFRAPVIHLWGSLSNSEAGDGMGDEWGSALGSTELALGPWQKGAPVFLNTFPHIPSLSLTLPQSPRALDFDSWELGDSLMSPAPLQGQGLLPRFLSGRESWHAPCSSASLGKGAPLKGYSLPPIWRKEHILHGKCQDSLTAGG